MYVYREIEIYIVFKSIIRWRPVKKMEMAQDGKEGWEGNDAMKENLLHGEIEREEREPCVLVFFLFFFHFFIVDFFAFIHSTRFASFRFFFPACSLYRVFFFCLVETWR